MYKLIETTLYYKTFFQNQTSNCFLHQIAQIQFLYEKRVGFFSAILLQFSAFLEEVIELGRIGQNIII
jgi:hypothetical protein